VGVGRKSVGGGGKEKRGKTKKKTERLGKLILKMQAKQGSSSERAGLNYLRETAFPHSSNASRPWWSARVEKKVAWYSTGMQKSYFPREKDDEKNRTEERRKEGKRCCEKARTRTMTLDREEKGKVRE